MEPIPWNVDIDGELNEANMQAKLESMGYSVSRYVYPPGTFFPDHSHSEDKIDSIVSGEFMLRMEGQSVVLKPGDSLLVPRGVVHSAEVVGHQPVVSLDAIKR